MARARWSPDWPRSVASEAAALTINECQATKRGREEGKGVKELGDSVKREGRWCAYWEEGTHHAGLSQVHGQAEPGRHGWWQQVAEARAHIRIDHSKAPDDSLYNQLRGEGSQSLHFWRDCPKEEGSRLKEEQLGRKKKTAF